jgi:hypothetical protein
MWLSFASIFVDYDAKYLTRSTFYDIMLHGAIQKISPVGATSDGGGCFLNSRGSQISFLFCLPRLREVVPMYMTWETFFLFCSLLVAVIGLVFNICNNKKR